MSRLAIVIASLLGAASAFAAPLPAASQRVAPSDRGRANRLAVARAGFIQRISEAASQRSNLLEKALAHPGLKLLDWHQNAHSAGRVVLARAYVDGASAPLDKLLEIEIDHFGRLRFEGADATARHLRRAGVTSFETLSEVLNGRLIWMARLKGKGVRSVADAIPVLQREARIPVPGWYRPGHSLEAALADGVNSPDAILLASMHEAMRGAQARVPLITNQGATLVLRARRPDERGERLWQRNGSSSIVATGAFPALEVDGQLKKGRWLDMAALRSFGVKSRAQLDRLIEDAMLAVAPEDY